MKSYSSIVCVAAWGLIVFHFSACNNLGKKPSEKKTAETKAISKSDSLAHVINGEQLVLSRTRCLDCHSDRNWAVFGGPIIPGTEGKGGMPFTKEFGSVPGTVYARNITPAGIGDWTDDELIRAITQGLRNNGDTLYPIMPYVHYNKLTREEILDIIAYVRTLKPVANTIPERELTVPINLVYPSSQLGSIEANQKPSDLDKIKYGEYLVNTAGCADCHTPVNGRREYQTEKLFSGGMRFKNEKFTSVSGNITPDSTTGIGSWSEEVFLVKFKSYRDPDFYNYNPGRKNSFMPWLSFSRMTDYDLKAIYAYLRTVKPVKNQVEKFPE